jgi:hypothetical protein
MCVWGGVKLILSHQTQTCTPYLLHLCCVSTCAALAYVHLPAEIIRARHAVVTNASVWDTQTLLPAGSIPPAERRKALSTPRTGSFVHLHLGIDAEGLPPNLDCHHLVVNDWKDLEVSVGGVVGICPLTCTLSSAGTLKHVPPIGHSKCCVVVAAIYLYAPLNTVPCRRPKTSALPPSPLSLTPRWRPPARRLCMHTQPATNRTRYILRVFLPVGH